jgi:hypothetical protein
MRRLVVALLLGAACTACADDPARNLRVEVGGASLAIRIQPGDLGVPDAAIQSWIVTSARAVSSYYGQFPVKKVEITVHPERGDGLGGGLTRGGSPPTIDIDVGSGTTVKTLKEDWVMTHEMTHLAFPNVPDTHHWIEEGLATYVEPFARLRIGELTPERVWGDLVEGLPQGLPEDGDKGLDHTPTWGRTYWGGALFCLLADVKIREETGGRFGLEDALRGIQAAGGSLEQDWPLARALEAGDKATGTGVLVKLYDEMKATPVKPDLAALWKKLGVSVRDGKVTFDDDAPLASVRRAMGRPGRS